MQNVAAWGVGGGGGVGGYFINERDTHVCSMTFAYVRIFHKVRYWSVSNMCYRCEIEKKRIPF